MKKIIKEFKEFISKGNIFDMAIGLIVGSAFTAIVNSLVGDIFSPLLTIVTSKADLTALAWNINGAQIKYGTTCACFRRFDKLGFGYIGLISISSMYLRALRLPTL